MDYLIRDEAAGTNRLQLTIPQGFDFQLIFRQERSAAFSVTSPQGYSFQLMTDPFTWIRNARALIGSLGLKWWLLGLQRLLRGRMFYLVRDMKAAIVHYGWLTPSSCQYYRVLPGDIVIGQIWTATSVRGKGIATYATKMAINALIQRGHTTFYIDTADTNVPCLKMIGHCEFGAPLASYVR